MCMYLYSVIYCQIVLVIYFYYLLFFSTMYGCFLSKMNEKRGKKKDLNSSVARMATKKLKLSLDIVQSVQLKASCCIITLAESTVQP